MIFYTMFNRRNTFKVYACGVLITFENKGKCFCKMDFSCLNFQCLSKYLSFYAI